MATDAEMDVGENEDSKIKKGESRESEENDNKESCDDGGYVAGYARCGLCSTAEVRVPRFQALL